MTRGFLLQPIGVITGLTREADCLAGFPAAGRPRVLCSGADPARAVTHARQLIGEGCRGLVSFGVAGGLVDGLVAGSLVVADAVVLPDGRRLVTAAAWRDGLLRALSAEATVLVAAVAGSDRIVGTVRAKRALAAGTGAVAVDMESHGVAAAAQAAGVPFLVVRAISDAADARLPAWVAGCIGADGSRRWGAVVAGVVGNPRDIPALVRLAGGSNKALAGLRRVAGRAGPSFGFP